MTITRKDLVRMFPRARKDWLDEFEEVGDLLVKHYNMERLDWVHFCGQIEAETNGLRLNPMRENMSFRSQSRIIAVYSYRLNRWIKKDGVLNGRRFCSKYPLAKYLVRKPKLLADIVYGGREGTPWMQGSKFIGRGPTQCTHKNNYRIAQKEVEQQPGAKDIPNLVDEPETLAHRADVGVRVAFAEFALKGLSRWARRDDAWSVSKILNTGSRKSKVQPHGLARRKRGTAKAKGVWSRHRWATAPTKTVAKKPAPDPEPDFILNVGDRGDDVAALQKALHAHGYFSGDLDGIFGDLTRRSVVLFQSEHGLDVTGEADWSEGSDFRDVLESTDKIDLGKREKVTARELRKKGSRTIKKFDFFERISKAITAMSVSLGLDKLFDFGAFEGLVSQTEKVKALGDRTGKLVGAEIPWAFVVLLSVLLLGIWGWQQARAGKQARVEDSKTGKNLGRA